MSESSKSLFPWNLWRPAGTGLAQSASLAGGMEGCRSVMRRSPERRHKQRRRLVGFGGSQSWRVSFVPRRRPARQEHGLIRGAREDIFGT